MQVILSAFRHPFPCRAAEGRLQIIRILSLHAVTPYIKIMIGIILAFFRLQEPGMLIRTVVQNQIHDNTDPPFLRFRNQFIHILQLTENRINILIIGDIITIIILRRTKYRRQPNRINSQLLQIRELLYNPLKISYSIRIAVIKASGINLINNRLLPPFRLFVFHI